MSQIPGELLFSGGSLYLGAILKSGKVRVVQEGLPSGILLEVELGPFEGGIRIGERIFMPLFMTDNLLKCTVEGLRVTQFQLGDSVHLVSECSKKDDSVAKGYAVTFLPVKGFSRFVGRIAIGNRSDPKGKLKEVGRGMDRMIFLEALEGFEAATLQLEIRAL